MKLSVKIPEGVETKVDGFKVTVTGKKGNLEKDFFSPLFQKDIKIDLQESTVTVSSENKKRKIKSEVGCIAANIRNMIKGVTEGYTTKMKVVYLHFPVTVKITGNEIMVTNFLGEKFPRKALIVGDTKVEVKGDEITVTGIDKNAVGQTAANIERSTHISSRDRRVFQDGIFVTQKAK